MKSPSTLPVLPVAVPSTVMMPSERACATLTQLSRDHSAAKSQLVRAACERHIVANLILVLPQMTPGPAGGLRKLKNPLHLN